MASTAENTQCRTFLNWCNKYLDATHQVNNLQTDFCDGIKLVALVEALAKQEIRGRAITSDNRIFWHANVSLALDFLQESQGLQLVNIGKQNILYCWSIITFDPWCVAFSLPLGYPT